MDFSERRSEEMISFFWRSVYNYCARRAAKFRSIFSVKFSGFVVLCNAFLTYCCMVAGSTPSEFKWWYGGRCGSSIFFIRGNVEVTSKTINRKKRKDPQVFNSPMDELTDPPNVLTFCRKGWWNNLLQAHKIRSVILLGDQPMSEI